MHNKLAKELLRHHGIRNLKDDGNISSTLKEMAPKTCTDGDRLSASFSQNKSQEVRHPPGHFVWKTRANSTSEYTDIVS